MSRVDRREFIKTSSAAAAAVGVLSWSDSATATDGIIPPIKEKIITNARNAVIENISNAIQKGQVELSKSNPWIALRRGSHYAFMVI